MTRLRTRRLMDEQGCFVNGMMDDLRCRINGMTDPFGCSMNGVRMMGSALGVSVGAICYGNPGHKDGQDDRQV